MPAHARYREDELVGIVKKTIEEIKGDGLFYPEITASTLIKKIQIEYPDITRYYIDLPCCKEILFKYRKERAAYIESNLTSEKNARKILTTTNKVDRYMKAHNYNVNDAFLAYEKDVRDGTETLFAELRKERRRNENLREIIQAKDNGNSRFDALIRKKEEIIKGKENEIEELKQRIKAYEEEKDELIRQAGLQVMYDIGLSKESNDNPIATKITYIDDLKQKLKKKRESDDK